MLVVVDVVVAGIIMSRLNDMTCNSPTVPSECQALALNGRFSVNQVAAGASAWRWVSIEPYAFFPSLSHQNRSVFYVILNSPCVRAHTHGLHARAATASSSLAVKTQTVPRSFVG